MIEWGPFLQLLNLPIFLAVLYAAVKVGRVVQQLLDHERRLEELEGRAWGRRSRPRQHQSELGF